MDIRKKRFSPKEQEISSKNRKVCKVGNKQITAAASMKPDLSKDVIGLQSFLSMHQVLFLSCFSFCCFNIYI